MSLTFMTELDWQIRQNIEGKKTEIAVTYVTVK